MNLEDWHLVFVSFCLVLVLIACVPLVLKILPSREEYFFALAVLGENRKAEGYYPKNDPRIEVGEEVRWNIYLYNHMGEAQYVSVKVKLLNSTISAPNSTSIEPSSTEAIYEIRRIVLKNETWLYPFSWSIEDLDLQNNYVEIKHLKINTNIIEASSIAQVGTNYRLILELWVYDENIKDFRFGWINEGELYCAWNQIWFNATLTAS